MIGTLTMCYINLIAKKLNNKTSAEEQKELEQWTNENEENKNSEHSFQVLGQFSPKIS